ncbi:MAG TPA: TRAP transporter large permease subunit [bacterium]|nr:TRAP transporter large permease subunit [bacterium]
MSFGIPAAILGAFMGVPIFLVLAAMAFFAFAGAGIDSTAIAIEMTRLSSAPLLVAIPLFTFAGTMFAEAGTPRRLVRVSRELLGWMPGGLSYVVLATCAIFTAFTGASGVTIVALGGLLLPALLHAGYPERFSLGLVTTTGSLGLLFPPSLPILIYAYVAQVPLDDLFLAGVVPGVLLIILLGLYAARTSQRAGIATTPFRWRNAVVALREAIWEVPLPFVVLGGIYSGKITVTEAASLTALYAIVAEVILYRDIPLRRIPEITQKSMALVAGILLIVATAFGFTNYLIDAEIPMRLLDWMQGAFTSKWSFLLVLNVFLLVVSALLDVFSSLIVVLPLIVPIASAYEVNLVHLGIIFLTNLEIGYSMPPLGLNLFIASLRFRRSIVELARVSLPFVGILAIALALITYVPSLSLFLVRALGKGATP